MCDRSSHVHTIAIAIQLEMDAHRRRDTQNILLTTTKLIKRYKETPDHNQMRFDARKKTKREN